MSLPAAIRGLCKTRFPPAAYTVRSATQTACASPHGPGAVGSSSCKSGSIKPFGLQHANERGSGGEAQQTLKKGVDTDHCCQGSSTLSQSCVQAVGSIRNAHGNRVTPQAMRKERESDLCNMFGTSEHQILKKETHQAARIDTVDAMEIPIYTKSQVPNSTRI